MVECAKMGLLVEGVGSHSKFVLRHRVLFFWWRLPAKIVHAALLDGNSCICGR